MHEPLPLALEFEVASVIYEEQDFDAEDPEIPEHHLPLTESNLKHSQKNHHHQSLSTHEYEDGRGGRRH